MRYAVIRDGRCVNIVEATEDYASASGLVMCSAGFGIGDWHDGKSWTHDEPVSGEADLLAMAVDQEYRLTLLELGV